MSRGINPNDPVNSHTFGSGIVEGMDWLKISGGEKNDTIWHYNKHLTIGVQHVIEPAWFEGFYNY